MPLFYGIDQDGDHHVVELAGDALENVDVAQRHRIERSWAYRAAHDR